MPSQPYVPGECGVFLDINMDRRCKHPVDPASEGWRMCSCCYAVFGPDDLEVAGTVHLERSDLHFRAQLSDGQGVSDADG